MISSGPRHLFVYGTLKRGSRSPYARLLQSRARFVDEASAPGLLYHLGQYPGAIFDPNCSTRVFGEVFHIMEPTVLLALDAYEGCRSGRAHCGQFRRDVVEVELAGGRRLAAWSYSYTGRVSQRAPLASGSYLLTASLASGFAPKRRAP